jgi:CDP-2,3-bis-(O-geranylgeranyl)-sn-glycerol synthase
LAEAWYLVPAGILWVLLPTYSANALPTFARFWPWTNPPMDGGRLWPKDGRRILGTSKTWVGFTLGVVPAIGIGMLEAYLFSIAPPSLQIVPAYSGTVAGALPVVILLTAGALAGDALGSFVKRRRNIPSSGRFFPWDQTLFVIVPVGFGLVLFPGVFWATFGSLAAVGWVVLFTIGFHVAFNYVGYWVGLKKVPW